MENERKVKSLSRVQLSATPWTVAYQAPLSMRFSRQRYWSGLPLPSPTEYLQQQKRSSQSVQKLTISKMVHNIK